MLDIERLRKLYGPKDGLSKKEYVFRSAKPWHPDEARKRLTEEGSKTGSDYDRLMASGLKRD